MDVALQQHQKADRNTSANHASISLSSGAAPIPAGLENNQRFRLAATILDGESRLNVGARSASGPELGELGEDAYVGGDGAE